MKYVVTYELVEFDTEIRFQPTTEVVNITGDYPFEDWLEETKERWEADGANVIVTYMFKL